MVPAINQNRTIHHLSVSQLNQFSRCERIWYFDKVLGLPGKSGGVATQLGSLLHKQWEDYLKFNQLPTHPMALPALELLPRAGMDGLYIEWGLDDQPKHGTFNYNWSKLKVGGTPFEGYIDVINVRDPTHPEVIDHKTTRSIDEYAKPEEAIRTDPQLLGYGMFVLQILPQAVDVRLSLIYTQTQGMRVEKRSLVLTPKEIEQGWSVVPSIVERMKVVAKQPSFQTVTPNWSECSKFGGCPYISQCKNPLAQLQERIRISQEKKMGLFSEQRKLLIKEVDAEIVPPDAPKTMDVQGGQVLGQTVLMPPQPEIPEPTPAMEKLKAKRGRPTGSRNKPKLEAVPDLISVPVEILSEEGKKALEADPGVCEDPRQLNGFRLFVNCLPLSGEFKHLDSYIADKAAAAAKLTGVPDIRLTEFGKGPGTLAALVREEVPATGDYVILGLVPGSLAQIIVDALIPLASYVVRGVR